MLLSKTKHEHRWYMSDVKKEFKSLPDGNYELVEYAFCICSCPGLDAPLVKKVRVESE